jgi:hypothetical protein
MSTDYDYAPTDAEGLGLLLGIYGVIFLVTIVLGAVSYVLIAIPLAALFRKAGIEQWKAWVPFYNHFTWLQLGGQSGHWMWAMLVPYGSTLTSVLLIIGMHRTGKAFGKSTGFLVLGIFLPWVWLFILGYGRDTYRPELIAAAGLGAPLVGYGAVVGAAREHTAYPPYVAQQPQTTNAAYTAQPAFGEKPGGTAQPVASAEPVRFVEPPASSDSSSN